MKIPTVIHPEPVEVDVEISVENITQALNEEPDTIQAAFRMMNAAAGVMNSVSDEIIGRMQEGTRRTIAEFLLAQAARFQPAGKDT